MSDSLRPHGLWPTRLLCPWDFPGNSTGVDCHFLLQGIFPTQGLNPGLPHCRQTLKQAFITVSLLRRTKLPFIECAYVQGRGFPCGSVVKKLPANAGDMGSIPGSGRSLGGRNGNPLQYSCLGNSMDRGAWQAVVTGSQKSWTQLSD